MSKEERKSHLEEGELDDEDEESSAPAAVGCVVLESFGATEQPAPPSPVEIEMNAPAPSGGAEKRAAPEPDPPPPVFEAGPNFGLYDEDDDDDDDDYGLDRKRLKIDESEEPAVVEPEAPPAPLVEPVSPPAEKEPPAMEIDTSAPPPPPQQQIDIKLDRATVGMTVIDALVDPAVVFPGPSKLPEETEDKAASTGPVGAALEEADESSSSSAVSAISAISSASLPNSEVSMETKPAPELAAAEEKGPAVEGDAPKTASPAQPTVEEATSLPVEAAVVAEETTRPTAEETAVAEAGETAVVEDKEELKSGLTANAGDTSSSVNSFKSAAEETDLKPKIDQQPLSEPAPTEPAAVAEESEAKDTEPGVGGGLKVPPLKIICSNATGLPYVKTKEAAESDASAVKPENEEAAAVAAAAAVESCKVESEVASHLSGESGPAAAASSDLSSSPVPNTRSKVSRSGNSRVSSPVPVSASANKAATRRSQQQTPTPAATVGRASPVPSTASGSGGNGASSSQESASTANMTAAEVESANRRKLRSHTRQQQGDPLDPPPTTRSSSAGATSGTKSPSPVNVMNENTNSNNSISGNQGSSSEEAKEASGRTSQPCECSNDSTMDTHDSNAQSATSVDLSSSQRKRRTRNGGPVDAASEETSSRPLAPIVEGQPLGDTCESTTTTTVKAPESFVSMSSVENLNLMTLSSEGTASTTSSTTETESMAAHEPESAAGASTSSATTATVASVPQPPEQPPVVNCIRKYIELRSEIRKKRDAVEGQLEAQLPKNYKDFVLYNRRYLIKSNEEMRQSILIHQPPPDLPEELKKFFVKQENERATMNTRHRVERHKLKIMQEQETLRCYNRFVREAANQTLPFSFCTMVKDDEVYSLYRNIPTEQQLQAILLGTSEPAAPAAAAASTEQTGDQAASGEAAPAPPPPPPQPTAEEKFTQALADLEAKFSKIRDDQAKRQLNESDSLNAVQKMDFQSKLKEFMSKHKQADSAAKASAAAVAGPGSDSAPSGPPIITLSTPTATSMKVGGFGPS